MEKVLVVEANEIPKRVIEWWANRAPDSATARLLRTGSVAETVLDEALPRDLYPSQSWASVGTGVPHASHGVFWYGDPKPAAYPFYWQAAAQAGRSVGLMGVLHTSPVAEQAAGPAYRFVVPDVFGDDATTVPASLAPIQELSLRLTRESARVASIPLRPGRVEVSGALAFARHGVRPSTWAKVVEIAAGAATGRWNKERLRAAQTLLTADVFLHQIKAHDPDLSVFFANHVAAFMHRYWAASFPEDWAEGSGYDEAWRAEHENELPFAMEIFDRALGQMLALAEQTDRTVLLVSSMGQHADNTVDTSVRHQAILRSPETFLAAAGLAGLETRSAMVPQLTVVADDASHSDQVQTALEAFLGSGLKELMVAADDANPTGGDVLTFTYAPECRDDAVWLGGRWMSPESVGMSIEVVTDHRSGRHSPIGVLGSNRTESWPERMDAFDVAPLILERLGVPRLDHHNRVAVPA